MSDIPQCPVDTRLFRDSPPSLCRNPVLARQARDGRYYCAFHHPAPDVQARMRRESAQTIAEYRRADGREGGR